jgi:hypothetical protein
VTAIFPFARAQCFPNPICNQPMPKERSLINTSLIRIYSTQKLRVQIRPKLARILFLYFYGAIHKCLSRLPAEHQAHFAWQALEGDRHRFISGKTALDKKARFEQ